ncbi:MAG: PorP/SprF family type IX secretion system membrane protein [Bacteroidota bacterium]
MKVLLVIISFFVCLTTFSQTRFKFKQYMIHQSLYNPGYADRETKYSFNSLYRRQWLRQENFPEAFFIYGHYNFDKTHSVTGIISNDLINKYNQFEISGSYIYNIELAKDVNLGLGAKIAFNEQNLIVHDDLVYFDPNEPTLDGNFTNKYLNFGTGISLTSKTLNLHIALPYMFGNNFLSPTKNYTFQSNHLYASAGYKVRFNDWSVMYPTVMLYGVGGSKFHGSFNVNFLSNQLIWFGAGIDSEFTMNASLGVFMMSGFRVVYVIDNRFFPANQTTGVSHELSVSYAKSLRDNPFKRRKHNRRRR